MWLDGHVSKYLPSGKRRSSAFLARETYVYEERGHGSSLADAGGGFAVRALTRNAASDKARELATLGAEVVQVEASVAGTSGTAAGMKNGI